MGHARPRPKLLASKLLIIRQELGLSQPQIAKRLGIQEYTNVSKYERDVNEPSLMIVLAYARLVEIPVEYLIDDRLDLPL
ncbi:MAG TPA: helix-turn-helix transcriptional regulator [Pyrinomonadaceae bacterium]|nr:helix-turn-helix transcriptional regulator [Pyrinomonadaceae bacterium]HKU73593.1 helix-turn-helix transcriptional regulator [Pyrinomonadaceae bacterium]